MAALHDLEHFGDGLLARGRAQLDVELLAAELALAGVPDRRRLYAIGEPALDPAGLVDSEFAKFAEHHAAVLQPRFGDAGAMVGGQRVVAEDVLYFLANAARGRGHLGDRAREVAM